MSSPVRRAIRVSLACVAIASGLCALALLGLPLLLAALMLLFDNTAQGLMVLLGGLAGWFRTLLPDAGALPPWRGLALDPLALASAAALRMLPCLGGLLPAIAAPGSRRCWMVAAACWLLAAACDGRLAALALLPGILAASLLAGGLASTATTDTSPRGEDTA